MLSRRKIKILIFFICSVILFLFYLFVARPKLKSESLETTLELSSSMHDSSTTDTSNHSLTSDDQFDNSDFEKNSKNVEEIEVDEKFPFHIMGEVKQPGVYLAESKMIIQDAIDLAGGLTENADLLLINLAEPIAPHRKIYIPSTEEVENNLIQDELGLMAAAENTLDSDNFQKININTANLNELQTLNGIGPSKAQAILDYRSENGNFGSIEDLMQVPGIKEASFTKIKEQITVK